MNVIKQIQSCSGELTKIQNRVANLIIDNPEGACFLTLKEISGKAGVTETTVLNFCKNTGFGNFVELKKALRKYVSEKLSLNDKLVSTSQKYSPNDELIKQLVNSHFEILQKTYDGIRSSEIYEFASCLSKSEKIYIFAHGASMTIGNCLLLKLMETGADAYLIDSSNYYDVLDKLARANENDAFVLITMPVYAAQTVAISEYLYESGKKVMAITDSLRSPIVKNAYKSLLCASDDIVFNNSLVAFVSVTDIISSLYALFRKEKFMQYNDKTKELENFFKKTEIPSYNHEYYYDKQI